MINFSILNLLQRFHKLNILEELQSGSEKNEHTFVFPRQERYSRGKEGSESFLSFELKSIANEMIQQSLKATLQRVKSTM